MRSAGWLIFLLAGASLLAAQQQGKEGWRLLERLAQRYDQAKALQVEGTITTVTKSPSTETKTTVTFSMAFQKPNRFRFVVRDMQGKVQQLMVSDGTTLFVEIPALKQVLKQPAPKSGAPLPGGAVVAGSIKEQLAKVKEAKIVGKEKMGNRQATVVQVRTEDGMTVLLWIADNALWQTKVTLEGKRFVSPKGAGKQPNPFAEAMRQATITQVLTFRKVAFNPPLSPRVFAYKPPADFKVVERSELFAPPKKSAP